MNAKSMKIKSKTDWSRIVSLKDKDIDTSVVPEFDVSLFVDAEIRLPKHKEPVTLRFDNDALSWYKSLGRGYQTRMNAVLRIYMEAMKTKNNL